MVDYGIKSMRDNDGDFIIQELTSTSLYELWIWEETDEPYSLDIVFFRDKNYQFLNTNTEEHEHPQTLPNWIVVA